MDRVAAALELPNDEPVLGVKGKVEFLVHIVERQEFRIIGFGAPLEQAPRRSLMHHVVHCIDVNVAET